MDWSLHRLEELTPQEEERCLELMQPARRSALEGVRHERTRRMSVLGEWVVKNTLARKLGCPIEEVALARTDRGKPYAPDCPIHFSISHTGSWLAAAFHTGPVGIDMELLRPIGEPLARRICTPEDYRWLLGDRECFEAEDQGQRERFFQLWTAREAWYKCRGTGITSLRQPPYAQIPVQHHRQGELLIALVGEE